MKIHFSTFQDLLWYDGPIFSLEKNIDNDDLYFMANIDDNGTYYHLPIKFKELQTFIEENKTLADMFKRRTVIAEDINGNQTEIHISKEKAMELFSNEVTLREFFESEEQTALDYLQELEKRYEKIEDENV